MTFPLIIEEGVEGEGVLGQIGVVGENGEKGLSREEQEAAADDCSYAEVIGSGKIVGPYQYEGGS